MSSPRQLLKILDASGVLTSGWADTVAAVPRELFVPDTVEAEGRAVARSEEPTLWLERVYADIPLTTQVNDGAATREGAYQLPTSSSSQPSVMLQMLDLLDVADGQRVLEAGTGTGYNAAWLAHRLGPDLVTSVEVDRALVDQATKNVTAAGYTPRIVCGDADQGWPPGAPYDRLIATYNVPRIPYAWIEQTPRGRIVAPWGGSFFPHSFAVVDTAGGVGRGSFTGFPSFMRTRNARPHRGFLEDFVHHEHHAATSRTTISPWVLAADADALFFVGLALPDAWHLLAEAVEVHDTTSLFILADNRTSWACVDHAPSGDEHLVKQYGPRRLWDEAEAAYRAWADLGRPGRDRAGLTVTADGERVWIDTEDHIVPTPLQPGRP
ncbi:methyltransferase domain-containing protein [Streptomyces sp. NPDC055078]